MKQLTHLLTKAKYINTRKEQAGYSSQHKLYHLGLLWCHSPKGYLLQSRRWPAFCTGQDSKFCSLVGQTVCCLSAVPTSASETRKCPTCNRMGHSCDPTQQDSIPGAGTAPRGHIMVLLAICHKLGLTGAHVRLRTMDRKAWRVTCLLLKINFAQIQNKHAGTH